MDFIVGSTNDAKVQAAQKVLAIYFPEAKLTNVEVESNVSSQPIGDEETRLGAITRAIGASEFKEGAIGIGFEGGVRLMEDVLYVCNWGALALPDGTRFTAAGAQMPLPQEVARMVLKGYELGDAIDIFSGEKGIRQKEGAIGLFTAGVVKRDDVFGHILQALIGQWKYSEK